MVARERNESQKVSATNQMEENNSAPRKGEINYVSQTIKAAAALIDCALAGVASNAAYGVRFIRSSSFAYLGSERRLSYFGSILRRITEGSRSPRAFSSQAKA